MVACATVLTSCTDVLSEEGFGNCDDRTTVRLTISFGGDNGPMSRDVDSNNGTIPELDNTTSGQAEINAGDIYALVVDASGNFLYRIKDLEIKDGPANDGYYTRTLEGTMIQTNNNVRIVLLANLIQNKITVNTTTLDSKSNVETFIDGYEGQSVDVKTIYNQLIYNYDGTITTDSETNTQVGTGPWSLSNRRIPMWGQSQETTVPPAKDVTLTCYLYRAVAKVQIWVNEKKGIWGADGVKYVADEDDTTDDDFKITKITVNNANNKGYCVSGASFDENSLNYAGLEAKSYSAPSVPNECTLQDDIIYTVEDGDSNSDDYNDARQAYSDFIYLPEQVNIGDDKTPVTLSVDYVYNKKPGTLTIDFKENGIGDPFNVIRNHSYIFNIVKAENDIAFEVKVAPWEEDNMRGVPDQYTLTTDKSVIIYSAFNDVNKQELTIWTDYSNGWYIEWPKDEKNNTIKADWLTISNEYGEDNVNTKITLEPKSSNKGVTRTASFYVVAGNIKKEITVIMPQPPTANCYIAEKGENELIISIKGNGNDGATLSENGTTILFDNGDASLKPDKIGIIWETEAGLITLKDGDNNSENNVTTDGGLKLVDYIPTSNSIKYDVADLETLNGTGAKIGGVYGGNALIGAFKYNQTTQKYEVIWSWHIWVAPGLMSDITTQTVNENYVEEWTLNDYDVLDRNLGALANRPINNNSVASMGLLYQWGRKDPFIGAAYSNDQFPSTNPTGVLPVVHYYESWDAKNISSNLIDYTITHPTHLIYGGNSSNPTGLSSVTEIDEKGNPITIGGYLWGTNNGLSTTVKDLGSKTIYDPCPVGYRVPPVDAFVFKSPRLKPNNAGNWTAVSNTTLTNVYIQWRTGHDGTTTVQQYEKSVNPLNDRPDDTFTQYRTYTVINTTDNKSSDVENWNENLKYVPHNVKSRYWQEQSQYIYNYSGDWVGNKVVTNGNPIYEGNANYYGFYLNYKEIDEPITQYGSMYLLKDDDPKKITWLPLTGAYDPTKGVSFKSGNSTIAIEQGSSITVNSFLWTNSSVLNGSQRIPAAMFLHGTETGGGISGRHIHGMTQSNIKAEPHYAGAVRCVRDRAKTKWDINYVTPSVSISYVEDVYINIVSVNADWELIDPGEPWLQVTPDKGAATKGQKIQINLKLLDENVPPGSTSTLVFKIANESEVRKCVVKKVE